MRDYIRFNIKFFGVVVMILAAAVAVYTIIAIAPLLIVGAAIVGVVSLPAYIGYKIGKHNK